MTSLIDHKADIVVERGLSRPQTWFRYSVHRMSADCWAVLYAHELEMSVFDTRAEAEAYLRELQP